MNYSKSDHLLCKDVQNRMTAGIEAPLVIH